MNKLLLLIYPFVILSFLISRSSFVVIRNQDDFNNLQQTVLASIQSGKNRIYVSITPGTYIFKENHLTLRNIDAPNVKININGNGAILIPQGKEYKNGDTYLGNFTSNNCWMSGSYNIDIWSQVRYAEDLIEVIDSSSKECRLKGFDYFPSDIDYSNAYILITQWFRSGIYKITRIDGKYIYFFDSSLGSGYNKEGYNINNDYYYAGLMPRYKLCNLDVDDNVIRIVNGIVRLPAGLSFVREGTVGNLISIDKCAFNSLKVSNLLLWGNCKRTSSAAIVISNTKSSVIRIQGCEFRGLRGNIIALCLANNVCIENNRFVDCYVYGITEDNGSTGTIIRNNSFNSMGKELNNTFCIVCRGSDFLISNNTFTDFGYGGIGAGIHYLEEKRNICSGSIENNMLSYTSNYISEKDNHTIMDSGTIYLWTKNDGILVRNNFIHDIDGMRTNQGIYCDDGASGIQVIGNIVLNIHNSYCIGSRRDDRAEEKNTPGTGIVSTNINNVIRDNIVDGSILFGGNENIVNGCVLENNYVLISPEGRKPSNNIKNVLEKGGFIEIIPTDSKNGRLGVSKSSFKQLKRNREWKTLKKYFIKN